MSRLSENQTDQVMRAIRKQRTHFDTGNPLALGHIRLQAENLHLLLNPDVQLPANDGCITTKAWYYISPEFSIDFFLVSGSNIGGLPDGSIVEPNGHLMELVTINGIQQLRAVCEHDYKVE